jgi:hypothetical protein
MEGLNETTKQCVVTYGPLLDKLSISVKMELYKAIYRHSETMTEEVLSLGVALTADSTVRKYLNIALKRL